jgi:hypothetical protein
MNNNVPKFASKGEKALIEACQRLGIRAESQKTFPDLRGLGGGKLRFDAYATNTSPPFLMEFQGKGTHSEEAIISFGRSNGLRRIAHDQMKVDYCTRHSIPLLCISYKQSIPIALQKFIKDFSIRIIPQKKCKETRRSGRNDWAFVTIFSILGLFAVFAISRQRGAL